MPVVKLNPPREFIRIIPRIHLPYDNELFMDWYERIISLNPRDNCCRMCFDAITADRDAFCEHCSTRYRSMGGFLQYKDYMETIYDNHGKIIKCP